jgi:D-proline reductase (dithiol) PrdB
MSDTQKIVDGFRFMPPSLAAWIGGGIPEKPFTGEIPWTPLRKPLAQTTFALMTSAGISVKSDPPFDMARERREPTWGDPSFRAIPSEAGAADVEVNHLHITTEFIKQDLNVILPLARFGELAREGRIGRLAPTNYSYYGYQPDPTVLLRETMPRVAERMHAQGVEAVFLTPA